MLNHPSIITLRVLSHQAAFQPLFPKPVALCGVVVTQVENWHFSWLNFIQLGPIQIVQPVQIPLQSLPALKNISPPTQLVVVCKLTEGALNPPGRIIDKVLEQD